MALHRQQGLTLLELAVTLLILAMLTAVTVRSTSDLQNEARYEQTRERLDMVREAILGDPRKMANGQAVISGFVADMGRLPFSIHELLEPAFCSTDRTIPDATSCGAGWVRLPPYDTYHCTVAGWYTAADCASHAGAGAWVANTGNLGVGWRGPYLRTSQTPSDPDAFTDGWGREAQNNADHNYGWNWALTDPYTGLASLNWLLAQSLGADMALGGTGTYEADYPPNVLPVGTPVFPRPMAEPLDWLVDLSGGIGITLNLNHGPDGYCGFGPGGSYLSQQACENAGGTWSGSCTPPSASSCKSVGGKWQSCFFAPGACGATGGTAAAICQFSERSCATNPTEAACTAAGGTWVATASRCLFWNDTDHNCAISNSSGPCANAGGTWNAGASRCDFNEGSCSLAGGAWVSDCAFIATSCASAGGTWDSTNNPHSCAFTRAACAARDGVSNGSDCYMSHAEYTGAKYDPASCEAAAGQWTARVCLNVFFRNPYNSTITYASSDPVSFDAAGGQRTLRFIGFIDSGDADGDGDVTEPLSSVFPWGIPAGANAVGIYEYDGDCGPDNPVYPVGHDAPMPVDFHPRTTPPVIAW